MRAALPFIIAVALAGAVRAGYLLRMDLPVYDPWRHLQLFANLRAGEGFTLFEAQPYIWYAPPWYRLVAIFPTWVGPDWIAGALSVVCVAFLWLWLHNCRDEGIRSSAGYAAVLAAGFGPLVAFTCHYGSEAFALACLLAALWIAAKSRGVLPMIGAGLLFGVAASARLSLAFDAFLFLPSLRGGKRTSALAAGAAFPLALHWFRNHEVLSRFDYIFLWDGLAVRTSEFNPFTTLFLQGHPALHEALQRLHEQIVPWPEWIVDGRGMSWGLMAFVLAGAVLTLTSRRIWLILAAGSALAYFLVLDRTHSANFFRLYLGVFPVFFAAFGLRAAQMERLAGWRRAAWAVPVLAAVCGIGLLRPETMYPLEMVTPPAEVLTSDNYMVSCGMYQPESFMWRFPEKRFIGLPLRPSEFEDFRRHYPAYRAVVWHAPTVQEDLGRYLVTDGGFVPSADAVNEYDRRYAIFILPDGAAATE